MALGGRYYLHYPLSYHLYCPDRPDHVLRRYEHSLGHALAASARRERDERSRSNSAPLEIKCTARGVAESGGL